MEVTIDIKPGNDTNPDNLGARPENLLAADSPESPPGETSAFPNIGFPGDEKEGKIEPKNLLIMAALAAMYLL